jgi:hypothetical protein
MLCNSNPRFVVDSTRWIETPLGVQETVRQVSERFSWSKMEAEPKMQAQFLGEMITGPQHS